MGRNDTFVLYLYLKYKKGKWYELNYFEHIVQFPNGSCDVNIVTVDYSEFSDVTRFCEDVFAISVNFHLFSDVSSHK